MQGYGTELSIGLIVYFVVKDIIVPLVINWRKQHRLTLKTQKIVVPQVVHNNPNDKPGKSQECLKHMKKLTELATEVTNIKDDIVEMKKNNREDHREIFREINKLRR